MTRYEELINSLNSCEANNIDLLANNEYLRSRLETLQRENSQLRRQLRENCREAQILKRALDAAQFMAITHLAGQSASRGACMADGMPRSDWYWGRALLIDGRVHTGKRFTTGNIDEINEALRRAVGRYSIQGFWSLRARNQNRLWRGNGPHNQAA